MVKGRSSSRRRSGWGGGLAVGVVAVLLGVVATSGCGGPRSSAPAAEAREAGESGRRDAIAVRLAPLVREPISSSYSTSATLRADRRATVIARTRGVVERLAVEEGDRVEAGQAMAYLEDAEQRIAAQRARATAETRQNEFQRQQDLYGQQLVSQDEYEKARREASDALHAQELADLELSRTVIRAPIGGVVLKRYLDVGATVADGTPVYDLADVSPLYADINVPERHVVRLRPGQTVRLTADATGEVVDAAIERIAPAVDPATGTVKVTVAVTTSASLRPGAFVRADIITDTHDDALVAPRSALVAEGRRWQLYRLGEGDTVAQVEVRLGYESGDRVEIAEVVTPGESLTAGTKVVVAGAPALSDGAAVRVVDADGKG